ncbi:unnamed protein product [Aphanomyces euteiches]
MLQLRLIWQVVAWIGVGLLLYLSLTPRPVEIPVEHGDKYGHTLAYFVLTIWWAQLRINRWHLVGAFIALGVAIEFAQGWTGYRSFDYYDMVGNTVGVLFGALLAGLVPNLLHAIDAVFHHKTTQHFKSI